MEVDAAIARALQVSAELEIARARLRGDLEVIVRHAGLAGLDAIVNHECQRLGETFRARLAAQGFIA